MMIKEYKYFLDFHCHYNHLDKDLIKQTLDKENIIAITQTTNLKDYNESLKLKKENIKNLFFGFGLYPDNALKHSWDELEDLLKNIDFQDALVIGEIGLDYKITDDLDKKNLQIKLFEKQLEISKDLKKPVVVHTRGATKETLEVLKSWDDVQVILHWFSGTAEEIDEAFSRGYFLTQRFARPKIEKINERLDQLFIETDIPVYYNQKEITIESIKESYDVFCKKYNLPLDKIKEKTIKNFLKLFPNIHI